jgi:gliding motility-associated-like protein
MESRRIHRYMDRLFLRYLLLLMLGVGGTWAGLSAQTIIFQGIVPSTGPYLRGQLIRIYGVDVFDNNTNNCDSLVFVHQISGASYRFRANQTVTTYDYPGVSGTTDTILFTIPCTMLDGTYNMYIFDDENCDNACGACVLCSSCGWTTPSAITISGDVSAGTLTYPGNQIFCLGEPNPMPTSSLGSGLYEDLTFQGGAPGNAVLNPTTGELVLHSGWMNTPHTIRFTRTGCTGIIATTTVKVKPVSNPTITYDDSVYCKNVPSIAAPVIEINSSPVGLGQLNGTFSASPTLTGLNSSNGSVLISAGTLPGNYLITYTPNVDSCGTIATANFLIVDLDSARFNYSPEYCEGSNVGGFPATITSLPVGGGSFLEISSLGLQIDSITGQIDLQATPAATYIIGYEPTDSGCAVIKTDTVVIRPPAPSLFTVTDTVCANAGSISCTLTTPTAGLFFSPTGDVFFSDNVAGVINIDSTNTGGPYVIIRYNGDPTCPDSTTGTIYIQEEANADLAFADSAYCDNEVNPLPVFISGSAGGTFSIDPGAFVNPTTGEVYLDSSGNSVYSVYYITGGAFCPDTTTLPSIAIDPAPDATFDLLATALCQNSGYYEMTTVVPGATSNIWSISTLSDSVFAGGMVGDSLDTDVLPSGGPFKIVRTAFLGACQDSFVDFVTINPEEDASFAYVPPSYCQADQNPFPVILGSGGGSFSNGTGLNIADSTGLINLALSAGGIHTVTCISGGVCPDTATFDVTILDAFNPFFAYSAYRFCETVDDTLLAQGITVPNNNYVFSSVPPLPGLDSVTGNVVLSPTLGQSGNYLITMTLLNTTGSCVGDFSRSLVIDTVDINPGVLDFVAPAPNPGADSVFCRSEDSAMAVLSTPLFHEDGRYFSSPATLAWLNRDSGIVSLSATPQGTYSIFFVRDNSCKDSLPYILTVEVPEPDTLDYLNSAGDVAVEFCKSDSGNAFPFLHQGSIGVYSYVADVGADQLFFVPDSTTGIIDLTNSDPGYYTISFTETSGCPGTASAVIRVLSGPNNTALTFTPNDTLCQGDEIVVSGFGGVKYFIYQNDSLISQNQADTTTALQDGDSVRVVIEDRFGCQAEEMDVVTVFPIPDGIPLAVPGTVSGSQSIQFQMGTNAPETYFVWTVVGQGSVSFSTSGDSTGLIDPSQTAPIDIVATLQSSFTPGIATFYLLPKAKICVGDMDTVVVRINPNDLEIFIPEVFTPDRNGKNDTWLIQWRNDINPADYEIFVYNRGGGEVYYMDGLTDQWAGETLPDGVYWYVLQTRNGSVVDKGAVTIRRK